MFDELIKASSLTVIQEAYTVLTEFIHNKKFGKTEDTSNKATQNIRRKIVIFIFVLNNKIIIHVYYMYKLRICQILVNVKIRNTPILKTHHTKCISRLEKQSSHKYVNREAFILN